VIGTKILRISVDPGVIATSFPHVFFSITDISLWRRQVSVLPKIQNNLLIIKPRPWSPKDWTDSDDRVRGGSSYSELTCDPSSPTAIFHGNLDTKTLGGAGFASQRTTGEDQDWDLSKYDGITLDTVKSDGKKYTLILKDELLPKSPNGREQSTVSWEYDFKGDQNGAKVFVHWNDFKATYRGREKKDAKPLDLKHVKRISLMMRRYVGSDVSISV
jgi:hypothetical protein